MNRKSWILGTLVLVATLVLSSLSSAGAGDKSLEQRLQRLEDIEAIRSVMIAYGRALDKRDFKAYGELFAREGSWKGGMGGATGPENIANMVQAGFAKMDPKMYTDSNHVMTSMDISVDGDTATAWSRWLWVIPGDDNRPLVQRGGYYEDTFIREDGQWKINTRQAFTEINK
jgi:ketosteroid isomerase-like protein